jgi:WS/DGAT/MGAT family acyltransferase
MERMSGADALLWHMERDDTPLHTLKTAILDTSVRGAAVTIDELRAAVLAHLGIVRRATQRVVTVRGFGGRPFWVDDDHFDVDAHLDERALDAPGGRAELDRLHAELAAAALDRSRPLWAMTLVHGLEGGRQAVIVRVHHALTDGLGALNTFLAATTSERCVSIPARGAPDLVPPDLPALRRAAFRDVGPWMRALPPLLRDGLRSRTRAAAFRADAPDLPPFLGNRRNFCNVPSGPRRVCASSSLPFDQFRRVAKASGVTVNGVLHAIIAGAMRGELLEREQPVDAPTVAAFGISADERGATRRYGNNVTPTNVALFSNVEDPLERLRLTARSCREGVELRRTTGLDMAGRWATYTCRLAPLFRHLFANRWPTIVNHVTTANVAGPSHTRWAGDVEIVDWISFAVVVAPANVNITTYSYAGRMSTGLVTVPEVFDDPRRFLDRMAVALDELVHAVDVPGDR